MSSEAAAETVARAARLSRFLQRALASRPWLHERLADSLDRILDAEAMRAFIAAQGADEANLRPTLRQLRAWALCHIATRDLAGLADLAEVTATMTALAEVAVAHAHDVLRAALVARYGEPRSRSGEAQELLIVGMGKLGGRELNVSSDIDLIFVYPEDGDTDGEKSLSNFEFFERLGKQIIAALTAITEHGQVFRVDMRLRPNGDSGPLVASFDMLENYFVTQGREWERYAWIKARVIVGARWEELRVLARPFVFRKYLDFGAIGAMRELHAQIRREVARRERAHNVKLGPGGIREIEFIAQVFQLIRGGRDRSLQTRPTLHVLERLAERGILAVAVVAELSTAYVFLRRLEHRLQYLDDAQTHELPTSEADRAIVAAAMDFPSYVALCEELDRHRAVVSRHFDAVFAAPDHEDEDDDAPNRAVAVWQNAAKTTETAPLLASLGYAEAESAADRLAAMRASVRYRQLPDNIRQRYDALLPRIIAAAPGGASADLTLGRCLDLLDGIAKRGAYLALLQQYPQALRRVVDLVGSSSWAAQYLTRHPILLDELIDARSLEDDFDWTRFRADFATELDALEPDMERQMDVMRERHHAQVFRLLVQDVAGLLPVEKLADHLSLLADIVVDLTIPLCWRKIRNRHIETPHFAVVSYGKLGGKELGYGSDLDVIYLYADDAPEADELYIRLAQRVGSWLGSRTSAGILFETDLRLRPNGDSGLVACSIPAFRQYQLENAWVWEHQALTRARFTAGDPAIGEAFERIRHEILCMPRDREALRAEVAAMREKMRAGHPNPTPALFDLKHDRGGLVDVEFLIQYLVLGYSHDHPELTRNLGNIALLHIAADLGLIPRELAVACADSYRDFRRMQHRRRLNELPARVPPEEVQDLRAPVRALWMKVFSRSASGNGYSSSEAF